MGCCLVPSIWSSWGDGRQSFLSQGHGFPSPSIDGISLKWSIKSSACWRSMINYNTRVDDCGNDIGSKFKVVSDQNRTNTAINLLLSCCNLRCFVLEYEVWRGPLPTLPFSKFPKTRQSLVTTHRVRAVFPFFPCAFPGEITVEQRC